MTARDTSLREFFFRPHIIVLTILIVAALIGAITTAVLRIRQMNHVSQLDTYDACREFIEDEVLCQYAAANEAVIGQDTVQTTVTSNEQTQEVNTLLTDGTESLKSVTLQNGTESESYIIIEDTTYVKDYSDNVWAAYTDPEYQPPSDEQLFDFSSETAQSVVEFREHYKASGTQQCGSLQCYVYEITSDEGEFMTSIWFDTEEYLLRRYQVFDETSNVSSDAQIRYEDVTIEAPSPTKQVDEADIEAYL